MALRAGSPLELEFRARGVDEREAVVRVRGGEGGGDRSGGGGGGGLGGGGPQAEGALGLSTARAISCGGVWCRGGGCAGAAVAGGGVFDGRRVDRASADETHAFYAAVRVDCHLDVCVRGPVHVLELEKVLAVRTELCAGQDQGPLVVGSVGGNERVAIQCVQLAGLREIAFEMGSIDFNLGKAAGISTIPGFTRSSDGEYTRVGRWVSMNVTSSAKQYYGLQSDNSPVLVAGGTATLRFPAVTHVFACEWLEACRWKCNTHGPFYSPLPGRIRLDPTPKC